MPNLPDAASLWQSAVVRLAAAKVENPRLDARLLLEAAFGWPSHALTLGAPAVSEEGVERFEALLARRLRREPVSRILGWREFWSLPFRLSPATLDPRPETECLVQAVLDRVPRTAPLRLLDLGTGSGCALIALLTELPAAWGLGLDRAPEAIKMARLNAETLGVGQRSAFFVGDWTSALFGRFDVIFANPPYLPATLEAILAPEVRDFDPALALYGGTDGLDSYRHFAASLDDFLFPDGLLALEIGWDQGAAVTTFLQEQNWRNVTCLPDFSGKNRVIVANSTQTWTRKDASF